MYLAAGGPGKLMKRHLCPIFNSMPRTRSNIWVVTSYVDLFISEESGNAAEDVNTAPSVDVSFL